MELRTAEPRRGAPMADPRARLTKIRDGLTPGEWARTGGMTGAIIGLHVLGWGMLAAAVGGHYHITRTEIFGLGPASSPTPSACATLSTLTTSPRSTTQPASLSARASGRCRPVS